MIKLRTEIMDPETLPGYLALLKSGVLEKRVKEAVDAMAHCKLCPRRCDVDRLHGDRGYCRSGARAVVASYSPHFGEEDVLVGIGGSGTIFLTYCNLRCIFCQNCDISQKGEGREVSPEELARMMLKLQDMGCHNLNFVSPSHFIAPILQGVLAAAREGLRIPLVYNSGGYDLVEALQLLDGVFDIYMPDLKFADPQVSRRLADAGDYFSVAKEAVREMHRQVGDLKTANRGIAYRGLLVRHLVLPEDLAGTREIMEFLAREISVDTVVNIMGQYYPAHQAAREPALGRRVSRKELLRAVEIAQEAGLKKIITN